MAKRTAKKKPSKSAATSSSPAFPYTTKPGSLRKFLSGIPSRPKPLKVNPAYLQANGFSDTNDQSIIRVLKAIDFLDPDGKPTDRFVEFMKPNTGPAALGAAVKEKYAKIFEHSHEPHREQDATIRQYFNIHSGGGEQAMNLQIQTFKALCDYATFSSAETAAAAPGASPSPVSAATASQALVAPHSQIHIDLHIHLPETKSRRDYECIFEDIAKHLFGRSNP